MTRRQRRLPTLLGIVVVALLAPAAAAASRTPPAPAALPAHAVVLVAVPGLQWQDVRSGEMPAVAALARRASTGLLSVKVIEGVTRCGDGLLAISAGSRTRGGARSCTWDRAAWSRLRADNLHSSYRAHVGALGDALHRAGVRTAAVGPDAVPVLADASGRVDASAPDVATALTHARAVAVVAPELYDARGPAAVRDARAAVDAAVASAARQAGPRALLLVLGGSDGATGGSHLRVALATGPGVGVGRLTSASTGRPPYVELIDVAPTMLAALGVHSSPQFIGTAMRSTGPPAGRVDAFVDADRHATQAQRLAHPMGLVVVGVGTLVMLVFLLGRRSHRRAVPLGLAALTALALPVATFVPQALPWWRAGPDAYTGLVVVAAALVAWVAAALSRAPRSRALTVLAATAGVFALDQLVGAPLQLAAPLGDSPLIAGRFHGMGNIAFGFFAASSLLLAALLAPRLRSRRAAVVTVAAVGLVAVVVDGAPFLGDDVGGVLALVPAVGLLVLLVSGVRVSRRRVLLLGAAGAATALVLALVDYARPAARQTHMGRFVGSLLHGDGAVVVQRKLDSNLHQLTHSAFSLYLLLVLGFAFAAREPLGQLVRHEPGLASGLWAVTVAGIVSGLANDSGVAIAAMMASVTAAALLVLAGGARPAPSTTPVPAAIPLPSPPEPPLSAGDDQGREDREASRG